MATPVKRSAPGTAQFAAGEAVLAQWPAAGRDSPWHAAKVEAANEDGTFALSYPELARVNPAVPEGSIRSGGQGAAAPPPAHAGRIQCYSIAKDMLEERPEARPALVELCQALQRSSDVRGELSGLLRTLDAEDPAATATFEVPPPPTVGAPRPSARAEPPSEPLGRTISSVSSSTPPAGSRGQETPDEVFLGDARSLSVPGPNLKAAERLRQQLATTVESAQEGGEGAGEGAAEPAPVPAGAGAAPATLLASTFFMPAFEGADEAFKEFITSRLVYKYGQRDLQDRMIINWAVQRARLGEEHRLVPMWTLSDGNCLLHASLLGIWGLHDKKQIAGLSSLRAAMCTLLGTSVATPMRERFLAENGRQNTEAGFAWDEDQEEAEWQRVLAEARTQNTFLRPVHVLAMACVLKRPIIMYSVSRHNICWFWVAFFQECQQLLRTGHRHARRLQRADRARALLRRVPPLPLPAGELLQAAARAGLRRCTLYAPRRQRGRRGRRGSRPSLRQGVCPLARAVPAVRRRGGGGEAGGAALELP